MGPAPVSRRTLLRATVGLAVGGGLWAGGRWQTAGAAAVPAVVELDRDVRVTLHNPAVEMGQGIATTLAQCVAEELRCPMALIARRPAAADAWKVPPDQCVMEHGAIRHPASGRRSGYGRSAGVAALCAQAAWPVLGRPLPCRSWRRSSRAGAATAATCVRRNCATRCRCSTPTARCRRRAGR